MNTQKGVKDLLWFFLVGIAILSFSSIPDWAARSAETDQLLFRGAYFDEADYSVHLSMMQAGKLGDWAYQMRFTNEAQRPAFLRMFYIGLGHVSKWTGLEVNTTFELARWFLGILALFSIYRLCQRILPDQRLARAAFLLAVLGSGAGWLQLMLGAPLKPISPVDFWLIDAYVYFSISIFPAFSFSLALMAAALNLFLEYLDTGKWQTIAWIGLCAVISQTTNPIAFAVIDAAFAAAVLAHWWRNRQYKPRDLTALVLLALVQLPLLTYNFIILKNDPFWSQFTLQNQTPSPPPGFYFWGFLPFWLFAVYGVFIAFRERDVRMLSMTGWVLSGFALSYLPVLIQRRFLLGITIPLGILAVHGAGRLIRLVSHKLPGLLKREQLIYFTYILLSSITSIYLILGMSLYMKNRPSENFYSRDLGDALLWLDENAAPNDLVLADLLTSQLTAQLTDLRVYAGHPMETLSFEGKLASVQDLYQGRTPPGWLTENHVRWVIYGTNERKLSVSFSAPADLEIAYENNTVIIYRVKE